MEQAGPAFRAVDQRDELQRLSVSADEKMLAIVQGDPVVHDPACTAAKRLRLLEQRYRDSGGVSSGACR